VSAGRGVQAGASADVVRAGFNPRSPRLRKGGAAFEEVQALCAVYDTNVTSTKLQAQASEAAMLHPVRAKSVPSTKPRKKR
jgi:hypothetical protein